MTIISLSDDILNSKHHFEPHPNNKLRIQRLKNRMTVQDLAYRLRISASLICQYESDKRKISEERKKQIAKILNCSVDDI